jgi:uncharacterized repeat protein (TIGR03803 family)
MKIRRVFLVFGVLLGTAWAQETVLYSFCARYNCADGAIPNGGLVFDQNGNLYGTTTYGGIYNGGNGVVFKLSTTTGRYSVLYSFCARINCADGALPNARLVFDQNGNLYGTTNDGGANGFDGGVIFQLTPRGKYTILHSFCPPYSCDDGASPLSLVFDQQGNLYGATHSGGVYVDGTVFKLTPTGQESVLYSFCAQRYCSDGQYPSGSLLFDQNGNLYGVTSGGGDYGYGAVFKLAR